MVAVNLIFDPVKSSALATALAATTGIDGTNHAVDVPGAAAGDGSVLIAVWTLDLGGCTPDDVVSVSADATFSRDLTPAVSDPGEFGAAVLIGDAMTFTPFGTYSVTAGDAGVFPGAPDVGSAGFEINGGTPLPLPTATQQIAGSWANGSPGLTQLELLVIVDGRDSGLAGTAGAWSDLTKPTVDVTFTPGSVCFAAADPIPVDNAASSTVGTPAVVDVSLNDDNTPCDPLPGCAVYSTTVTIEPGSTAGGITASVDSAGVATVNATSAGTAIVTIESGCSPTCDPLGADVTVWVPQTLTVTFSEPTVPCAAQLVKTCLAETPIVGCAEYAGVPAPTVLHSVTGANGDVIPVGSVAHPAINGVGSDGSGFIRSYYTDIDGTVVAPDAGTFTPGDCPTAIPSTAFTAGGVAIGSGVHAATLGPDGTSWSAPTGLRSLTVAARKTSTTDVTGSAVNRIDVVLNGGTFRLLEGETFTWSVDDPDSIVAGSVNCVGDAAAAVVWVAI